MLRPLYICDGLGNLRPAGNNPGQEIPRLPLGRQQRPHPHPDLADQQPLLGHLVIRQEAGGQEGVLGMLQAELPEAPAPRHKKTSRVVSRCRSGQS